MAGMLWLCVVAVTVASFPPLAARTGATRVSQTTGGSDNSSVLSMLGENALSSAGGSTRRDPVTGSAMMGASSRRLSFSVMWAARLKSRHLCRSMASKQSNPFFSRAQQATTLLTGTLVAVFLCAFFLYVPSADKNTAAMQTSM
jgi:hypothetical protein